MSLLGVVFLKMAALAMRQNPAKSLETMKSLCQMFKFLIKHNLDPGQFWTYSKSDTSPLAFLIALSYFALSEFVPLIVDIARTIIQNSTQDPYGQADFSDIIIFRKSVLAKPSPIVELVLNPEHSDIDLYLTDELSPSVVLNRTGSTFKAWLGHSLDLKETIAALTSTYFKIRKILRTSTLKGAAKAYEMTIYKHCTIFLEAGLDPLLESGGGSLVSCLRDGDQLYVLRSALKHLKWSDDQISDLFEADLFASFTYQLAHVHIKDRKSLNGSCTLRYRYVQSEDWDIYVRNLQGGIPLSSKVYVPLSNPDCLDSSLEAARTKCQRDNNGRISVSIRSIVQASIKLGKEVLGFIV
jgi:hypothetical protein